MTDWNFFIRMIYKEVGVHSIFVLLKPFLFSVTALLQLFCVFLFYTSTNISGVRLTVWAHHFTGEITSCKLKFYAIFLSLSFLACGTLPNSAVLATTFFKIYIQHQSSSSVFMNPGLLMSSLTLKFFFLPQ